MSHEKIVLKDFVQSAIFLLLLGGFAPAANGQSDILFDAQRNQFRGSGWTVGAGVHWLHANPEASESVLSVVNEIDQTDTLHAGAWSHQGSTALKLGIGYWHVAKRPILWDRISIQLEGGKQRTESIFLGNVADSTGLLIPDTLTDIGSAVVVSELTLRLHRAIELKPDFFMEAQMGLGWDAEW